MSDILIKRPGEVKREAKEAISACRSNIKELIRSFRQASAHVRTAERVHSRAKERLALKASEKNKMRFAEAEEDYIYSGDEYRRAKEKISVNLVLIEKEYDKLAHAYAELGNSRAAERTEGELKEYKDRVEELILKNDVSRGTVPPPEAEAEVHADVKDGLPEPKRVSEPTPVKIAPVTIDVTPMVDKAVSAAIDRLNTALSRRLDEYAETLALPKPKVTPADETVSADRHTLDIEEELKVLTGLSEELRSVSAELRTIIEAYQRNEESQRELLQEERELLLVMKKLVKGKAPKPQKKK